MAVPPADDFAMLSPCSDTTCARKASARERETAESILCVLVRLFRIVVLC